MTPLQALEEAKKRYPEGTQYHPIGFNATTNTVKNPDEFSLFAMGDDGFAIFDNYGILYMSAYYEVWAEIVQPAKSLEERLVEEYGFEKRNNGRYGAKYELDRMTIYFDYGTYLEVIQCTVFIHNTIICTNPNNLEAFIKAYLGLFEK